MTTIDKPGLDGLVKTTPTSLELAGKNLLSIGEWSDVGRSLGRLGNAALWWVGDWFAIGERTYGSTYSEAMAITGLAYQTLRNVTSVCQSVELSRRRDNLSFGHHAEVAALAPWAQTQWLDLAEAEGLNRDQLRLRIRGDAQLPAAAPFRLTLTAPQERAARWQAAAESEGLEFIDWATGVLDEAAA